jgi:superoxide reductase
MKMFEMKYYKCRHCGNIFEVLHDGGATPTCCGEPMELLTPNTADAATEKHVPVIERSGDQVTVKIGSVPHPMLDEHYIQWVEIIQGDTVRRVAFKPGDAPEATFASVDPDEAVTAYEYCNLHGLWAAKA